MSKSSSSSAAVLVAAVSLAASISNAQSSNSGVLQNIKPNFYVTTPQTGEQTALGEDGSRRVVTSARSTSRQATEMKSNAGKSPARSAGTARPRSASAKSQAASQYAAYQAAQSGYASTYPQASTAQTVQSSANWYSQSNASGYTATSQATPESTVQTTYPSYVAHSTEERRGLISRLLHKKSSPASNVAQVSNSSYRPSKYSGTTQAGVASWYGSDFHGGKTASGERYNMESMTAAHKTLPFGTMVKVRNERNGQECVVRINNRGPFTKGRVLDVSKAAARQLGMIGSGVAKVSMQVIGRS